MIFDYITNEDAQGLQKFLARPDNKKKINDTNEFGNTALHKASQQNKIELVKILLENGADVNAIGIDDFTPLAYAASFGSTELAALLLEHGAEVNHKDDTGNSILITAVNSRETNEEIIALLLEYGANPMLKNNHGMGLDSLLHKPSKAKIKHLFSDIDFNQS